MRSPVARMVANSSASLRALCVLRGLTRLPMSSVGPLTDFRQLMSVENTSKFGDGVAEGEA
ncbi:MAG TPA: hypothetical protein VGJ18_01370 [Gemmatimonadaceae bacterium]